MGYQVVLLDVGETLIGPRESFGAVYARVLGRFGVDLSEEVLDSCIYTVVDEMSRQVPKGSDRFSQFAGGELEYWGRFARRTLKMAGAPDDSLAERALGELMEAFKHPSVWRVFDDVVPVLQELKADGVRMAVVSNWDSRLPSILEMLELAPFFEVVGVSHIEGMEKPNPEFFHRVLGKLKARPEQALHVGDVPELDLAGAEAAGVDCLLVDRRGRLDGHFNAHRDLRELPRIARG